MDFLDDFVMGPLNLIDRAEGLLSGLRYGDTGHQFAILRTDKGGAHTLDECEEMLRKRGIAVFGRTHDARHMYFKVKNRQAVWAEYTLMRAGVDLQSPPVEGRNAGWASKHSGPPPAWADRKRGKREGRARR
jgi:hypothetical protein